MRGFGFTHLSATHGVRLSPEDKMRVEILARLAGAHSTSDYLRTLVLKAIDAEERRLNLKHEDYERYAAMVRNAKANDRRGKWRRKPPPGTLP